MGEEAAHTSAIDRVTHPYPTRLPKEWFGASKVQRTSVEKHEQDSQRNQSGLVIENHSSEQQKSEIRESVVLPQNDATVIDNMKTELAKLAKEAKTEKFDNGPIIAA